MMYRALHNAKRYFLTGHVKSAYLLVMNDPALAPPQKTLFARAYEILNGKAEDLQEQGYFIDKILTDALINFSALYLEPADVTNDIYVMNQLTK